MATPPAASPLGTLDRGQAAIAIGAILAIVVYLLIPTSVANIPVGAFRLADVPLLMALVGGGGPLVYGLLVKLLRREFGSDLLAGLSMVTALLLEQYLAGTLVVLMLSGGEALESLAVQRASAVLALLARRMPTVAHRRQDGMTADVPLEELKPGDEVLIYPHEICPVDGTVTSGRGSMDESFLTGEPYVIAKTPGANVFSGAINGDAVLVVRTEKPARDSRYSQIINVLAQSQQRRPKLRRLADQLGAWYTPLAVGLAAIAWAASGSAERFLAVLVVATPCPLLIAIPVAIIGSISLAARRGILIRDPAILERLETCRTAIFDKTGTLTLGHPELTEVLPAPGRDANQLLSWVASIEQYSKHPLAAPVRAAANARGITLQDVAEVREVPGSGLQGLVDGKRISVTSRQQVLKHSPELGSQLPPTGGGLECLILVDGQFGAVLRFRDRPRPDGKPFITHLSARHGLTRVMLLSGDRKEESQYLADLVGIHEVLAEQSPEQKLAVVQAETARAPTLFIGDGINDAPAMTAATVGLAFGSQHDALGEAAGAVLLDGSLKRVDELLHISRRLRSIALQSAIGGMALSLLGMGFAAVGLLPPVAGALLQEAIDVLAVLNALRAGFPPKTLTDY